MNSNNQNAIRDFDSKVREALANNEFIKTREQAIAHVARKEPELHKAFLRATNPGKQIG